MTTLCVIAVYAITSLSIAGLPNTDASTAVQPEKFVFVEKVTPTAVFQFKDGTEMMPIQQFTQTAGFGTTTVDIPFGHFSSKAVPPDDNLITQKAKPAFTLEKIASATPYLYKASDEAQKYQTNDGFNYSYKFFDVKIFLTDANGKEFRTFDYSDCKVISYNVVTRSDNEEGYTGKGFAIVEQYSFECNGYIPNNPVMDTMNTKDSAKTISSNDLKSTDKWEPGFTTQK